MSKTLIFFGSGPVAAASLLSLADNFPIETVITKAVPKHHKGIAPVEELAKKRGLKLLFANNNEELDALFTEQTFSSQIGVVVDYGVIISQKVIDTFDLGIVNSHFSLLPQWRGADPITFSILSGQEKTGVSLMIIEPKLDTGKLITQTVLQTDLRTETTPSLTDKLITLSNRLLIEYLPRYMSGEITPKNQPHPDRATFSRKLTKQDGILDFTKSATELEREVRAFAGWPKSHMMLFGRDIIVTKAHVRDSPETKLDILCGDGTYFSIDELIGPSGRTMSGHAFLNGYAAA